MKNTTSYLKDISNLAAVLSQTMSSKADYRASQTNSLAETPDEAE